ncbi:unnamed protein product [Sympodiomycopsis kandeliae]
MSRPSTRPYTGTRPNTAASMVAELAEGRWICAVVDNNSTSGSNANHRTGIGHDVGIAALDKDTATIFLTELFDNPSYAKTVKHLSLHPPQSILVPESARAASSSASRFTNLLSEVLEDAFAVDVVGLPRALWNAQDGKFALHRCQHTFSVIHEKTLLPFVFATIYTGAKKLDHLLIDDALTEVHDLRDATEMTMQASTRQGLLMTLNGKHFALSALAARSLFIDPATILQLDLVSRSAFSSSQQGYPSSCESLNSLLNNCQTSMGSRLLKMNLLQPLTGKQDL